MPMPVPVPLIPVPVPVPAPMSYPAAHMAPVITSDVATGSEMALHDASIAQPGYAIEQQHHQQQHQQQQHEALQARIDCVM